MSLDSQTKKFNVIINFPYQCRDTDVLSKINTFCNKYANEYYYILHDKDVDEFGQVKTKHIHLLFTYKEKRTRLKRMLSLLNGEIFGGMDKTRSLITIAIWKDYEFGIQYLIHKNDEDKYQYKVSDVYTSDLETLTEVMDYTAEGSLSIDKIKVYCWEANSLTEVLTRVGLVNSRNYLNVIKTIYNEAVDYKVKYGVKNVNTDDLPF